MLDIHLYNTFTRKIELFKPLTAHKVGIYHCGPTVYDDAHIGNLRAYIFADILRRTLEYNKYTVTQVINITDVGHLSTDADSGEDKMTRALVRLNKPFTLEAMLEVGTIYTEHFKSDLQALNIESPHHLPRASEHIAEDVALISRLENKQLIYRTSDGVYFDTEKFGTYGALGGLNKDPESTLSRTEQNTEKRNPRDFALWKFNTTLGWESPWGKGFPGWHIECSAMSTRYLGAKFDIHTGGIDHIPTHHNNEIAQSEGAGDPFAQLWMHNEFLTISDSKMAKSDGNFLTLKSLTEKGYSPIAYRYLILSAHYRTRINWSFEALDGAQNTLQRLYSFFKTLPESGETQRDYLERFTEEINTDLDTPRTLATVWELVKDENVSPADKRATLLNFDSVLGLRLGEQEELIVPEAVSQLVADREMARLKKDFASADTLRSHIQKKGFDVKDTKNGPEIIPF
ncbi:MAG: cysteine--tRNA ligase [Patescibacteria group bacterium]